jgi:hypothetical protein
MGKRHRALWKWITWTVVLALVMLVAGYGYMMHPSRIRARVLAALQVMPVEGLDVAHATFSWRDGLQLAGIVIPAPIAPEDVVAQATPLPPLVHIGAARVKCDLGSLLLGRFRPTAIELEHVSAALVVHPHAPGRIEPLTATDAGTQLLRNLLALDVAALPTINIERGDFQLLISEGGELRVYRRLLLQATGGTNVNGYTLRIDHTPQQRTAWAELTWQPTTRALILSTDLFNLRTLETLAPARVAESLERIALRGRARIERLEFGVTTGVTPAAPERAQGPRMRLRAATLQAERLAGAIPIEALPLPPAQPEPFLKIHDGVARVSYRHLDPLTPGDVELRLQGRLRGAALELNVATNARLVKGLLKALASPPGTPLPEAGLDDIADAGLEIQGLELPTVDSYPAFLASPRLPNPAIAAFEDYDPRGLVNVRARVRPVGTRDAAGNVVRGAARFVGELEALDTTCRYFAFPYPFEQARGVLRYEGGALHLEDLTARHGLARIHGAGVINNTNSWTGFALTFRARHVAFDRELYLALPPEYRKMWEKAAPVGLCDVITRVTRPEGSPEAGPAEPDVAVDARLVAGSLALVDDRRLNHVDGRFSIAGGSVHLGHLSGWDAETRVRLSGDTGLQDGRVTSDLRVLAHDLPLEHEALLATARAAEEKTAEDPEAAGAAHEAARIRFAGRGDVWGRVADESDGARVEQFTVHVTSGTLTGLDDERAWSGCSGWAVLRGPVCELRSFACMQDAATLHASGVLPSDEVASSTLSIELDATDAQLEQLYPQFVPQSWTRVTETVGLRGPGKIDLDLEKSAADGAGPVATLRVTAHEMIARPLPLQLYAVSGDLTLGPRHFELPEATAQWGDKGTITLSGGSGTWDDERLEAEFNVKASDMTFSPALIEALPAPLARLLTRLGPQGEFDVELRCEHVREGDAHRWVFEGELPIRGGTLELGLKLSDLRGTLRGVCELDPEQSVNLASTFEIASGAIAGRPLRDWEGTLEYSTADPRVRLLDLVGVLCGGRALGSVIVEPQTNSYEIDLTLDDVKLGELFPPAAAEEGAAPAPPRPGRIDGQVYLRNEPGATPERRGGGGIRIRGASFLQTPVLADVAEAGQEQRPRISDEVDQADIQFLWLDAKIQMQRIEIVSADLRMVGQGTWDMESDTIDITLVGAHPRHWQRLPLITDLLESAAQELVQYRVEGSFSKPRVSAEPLYKLNETVRSILRSATGAPPPE